MYVRRTPSSKRDPVKQWRLPDRVFFAAGACHILALAFLQSWPKSGFEPRWIRPIAGHTGNHIVLVRGDLVFDYHGYSRWNIFWPHTKRRANQWWPGWDADIVPIHAEALISNKEALPYVGLHMKEPKDYLYDPLPRALHYLARFPPVSDFGDVPAGPQFSVVPSFPKEKNGDPTNDARNSVSERDARKLVRGRRQKKWQIRSLFG